MLNVISIAAAAEKPVNKIKRLKVIRSKKNKCKKIQILSCPNSLLCHIFTGFKCSVFEALWAALPFLLHKG